MNIMANNPPQTCSDLQNILISCVPSVEGAGGGRERKGKRERFMGDCLKIVPLQSEGQFYGMWTAGIPLLTFSRQDLPISPRKLAGVHAAMKYLIWQ